jgi:two-component system response regulator
MKRTVLIIDDSADEVHLTERIIAKSAPDISVEWAASGEQGLAKLRSGKKLPFLILLDLKMTGLGGIDTLRQIRGDERLRSLRVAIVTNSDLESEEKNAMEAGADVFLRKAFDIDEFEKDINSLLNRFC